MNAITTAINSLGFKIPKFVLDKLFKAKGYNTWQSGVVESVIYKRILPDTNLRGYHTQNLLLSAGHITTHDNNTISIHYRMDQLDNREIVAAYAVMSAIGPLGASASAIPSTAADSPKAILAPSSEIAGQQVHNVYTQVVGKNTVSMIGEVGSLSVPSSVLQVSLGSTKDFNDLNPKAMVLFTDLVVAATKAYLYNEFRGESVLGKMYGGVESTALTDIIEEYSEEEIEYQTLLSEKWGNMTFMNDVKAHHRILQVQLSPFLD